MLNTICCVKCRRPTFSEAKRVLYTLLSVFEPSSHALQALADRSKPVAVRPPKPSLKKEEAVATTEPEVQAPKASCILTSSGLEGSGLPLHNFVPSQCWCHLHAKRPCANSRTLSQACKPAWLKDCRTKGSCNCHTISAARVHPHACLGGVTLACSRTASLCVCCMHAC